MTGAFIHEVAHVCENLLSCMPMMQTLLCKYSISIRTQDSRDFPGGPVDKTLGFYCRGLGLIPGQGTKILHALPAVWPKTKQDSTEDRGLNAPISAAPLFPTVSLFLYLCQLIIQHIPCHIYQDATCTKLQCFKQIKNS